jgi:hypothetical protein
MEPQNREACLFKESSKQSRNEKGHNISLRDIPLKVRRKDARKPLFLIRYE